MEDSKRRDLLSLAALLALPTLLFADVLFGSANLFQRDLFMYHFPMKRIVREAMLSGEFPFWQRYIASGQPLAANPAWELFYPGQWPILIGSYPFGFALHIVLHLHVAAAGMFLLLRRLTLARPASLFGATTYALGGVLIGSMSVLPTYFVWAMAPLVAWAMLRALAAPSAATIATAALTGGLQLLIGEPMSIVQVWLLIGAGAVLFAVKTARSVVRTVALAGLVATASAFVAAVQLVPAADHVRDSARARGFDFDTVAAFAMPPMRGLELFSPNVFRSTRRGASDAWGENAFRHRMAYFDTIYPGIAVAALVLAGLILRAPGTLTVSLIGAFSLLLAIGDRTPLLRLLYDSGLAKGVRYSEKFVLLGVAAAVVFAAFVCDRLLRGDDRVRRAVIAGMSIVVAVRAVPVVWSMTPGFVASFQRFWRIDARAEQLAEAARASWRDSFVLGLVLLVILMLASRLRRPVWMSLLAAAIIADVALLQNGIIRRMPPLYFTPPVAAAAIEGDPRDFTIFHRGNWLTDDPEFRKHEALSRSWLARNGLRPLTPAAWSLRTTLELDYDETALLPTHDMIDTLRTLGNSGYPYWGEALATLSNVRYIADFRNFEEALAESGRNPLRHMPVRLTRVREQPRYFFATKAVEARTTQDVMRYLVRNPPPYGIAFLPFAPPPAGTARVTRSVETSSSATIDVDASAPALLVMTVTRHKYWRAFIDGKETAILPANIAFQAVVVPPGRHRVEMRYRNPLVFWSGLVSLIAIAAAAATILIRRRPRPRSGS